MTIIYFMIPYDEEHNYCVLVNEKDKEIATELVNMAYNDFIENDNIGDFQEYAICLLKGNNIEHEFSIWNKVEDNY